MFLIFFLFKLSHRWWWLHKNRAAFLNKPCLVICTHAHQIKISKIFKKLDLDIWVTRNSENTKGINYLMNKN